MAGVFWEELVRNAMLGTDRKRLSPEITQWLAGRSVVVPPEPGRALMAASGAYSLLKRATAMPASFQGELPPKVDRQAVSGEGQLAVISRKLVKEPYKGVLPEFVNLCRQHNKELPPESLPVLLDQALTDADIRLHLPALTGERGKWLCRQNPSWAILQWDVSLKDWDRLGSSARYGLLAQLREEDREAALDQLIISWPELAWKDKVRFLGALTKGLLASDVPFLEMALKDGRMEVRKKAAELLLLSSEGQVAEKAWEETYKFIQWSGRSLEIELPEEADSFLQEYRLNDSSKVKGMSLRQGWLFFRVVVLPLSGWSADRLPAEWLEGASRDVDGKVLLRAWWEANQRDLDPDWSLAWLEWLLAQPQLPEWVYKDELTKLCGALGQRAFNKLIRPVMNRNTGLIREGSVLHQLFLYSPHTWEESISWSFLSQFQEYVESSSDFLWSTWHYRDLLRIASLRIWPGLAEEVGERWGGGMIQWGIWEKEIFYLLDILSFRNEMWLALD